MIKLYYRLTKPGIIYGNLIPAIGSFLYASKEVDWLLFAASMGGLSLVIASACVFNNYFDREIDARMERTKERALASGKIPGSHALAFASVLGLAGALVLFLYSSPLALAAAFTGWVVYVALYTPAKHRTAYALFIGAFAGATPPVVGYTAVTNSLDLTAILLFAFLFLWQLPHFMAIAIYRYDEYAAAGIPLFVKAPSERAKRIARHVFSTSLLVLLAASLGLALF